MADPLTLEQRVLRGKRAAAMLDDDLMIEAGEAVEAAIVDAWKREMNPERRQVLWCELQAVHRVALWLNQAVDDGAIAKRQIDQTNHP